MDRYGPGDLCYRTYVHTRMAVVFLGEPHPSFSIAGKSNAAAKAAGTRPCRTLGRIRETGGSNS